METENNFWGCMTLPLYDDGILGQSCTYRTNLANNTINRNIRPRAAKQQRPTVFYIPILPNIDELYLLSSGA